jgi:hypothetical protein
MPIFVATGTDSGLPDWIPVAALVTGALSLIGIAVNRYVDRRDRRRTLYAEAYKAAVAWVEMLYRVRRRDPERPYELAARFHEVQERVDFHQGWIDAEHVAFGRAYRQLVAEIKRLTFDEIKEAWRNPPCDPNDGFSLEAEVHPPVAEAKGTFVADLRDHMSLRPWRRQALKRRYRDEAPELVEPNHDDRRHK